MTRRIESYSCVNGTRVRCHIYLKSSSLPRTLSKSFLECELTRRGTPRASSRECVIERIVEHFSHANIPTDAGHGGARRDGETFSFVRLKTPNLDPFKFKCLPASSSTAFVETVVRLLASEMALGKGEPIAIKSKVREMRDAREQISCGDDRKVSRGIPSLNLCTSQRTIIHQKKKDHFIFE